MSFAMPDDRLLWDARAFIYGHLAATARAPAMDEVAERLGVTSSEAEAVLRALHERHALFLEPGTARLRMANPFSASPTDYEVTAGGQTYWANCAWDSFGIAAALHATEAEVRAKCAASGEPLRLRLAAGQVEGASVVVHFQVPFEHWYDNLVFT